MCSHSAHQSICHFHAFPDVFTCLLFFMLLLVGVFRPHFQVIAVIVFSLLVNPITIDNYSCGSVKCEQLRSLEREESYLKAKHDPENTEAWKLTW